MRIEKRSEMKTAEKDDGFDTHDYILSVYVKRGMML
jgi:hypothetical protein